MPTYVIGDVQGCFDPLNRLLDKIHFDPVSDTLYFTGDLVNRGPQSLETLRFVKNLGDKHQTVLGNHDLHLLAVFYNVKKTSPDDTLQTILAAPDCIELMDWLRRRPFILQTLDFVIVHAGLSFNWDLEKALQLAQEVETFLENNPQDYFQHMYGNFPDHWDDNLQGHDRLRVITNYFTRLRFCYPDGRIELKNKSTLETAGELIPWFKLPQRVNKNLKIIFGHWAALNGVTETPNIFALDTGCVWGNALTAMRLPDQQRISVSCHS